MTATELTLTERINQALADLRTAERELAAYSAEWAPVFEHRDHLQEEVDLCKAALLELLTESNLDYVEDDEATVTVVRTDRGSYDASRLPKTDAVLEACTLSIDKASVERLVRSGVITEEQAQAAWESRPARPYLRITPVKVEG